MEEVYDIGTDVEIYGPSIKAKIKGICIEGNDRIITYKCMWWEKDRKREEWLERDEFSIKGDYRKKKIGFSKK